MHGILNTPVRQFNVRISLCYFDYAAFGSRSPFLRAEITQFMCNVYILVMTYFMYRVTSGNRPCGGVEQVEMNKKPRVPFVDIRATIINLLYIIINLS